MGRHYKDLAAWQKAMELVELVYVATRDFPKREIYGLANLCFKLRERAPRQTQEIPEVSDTVLSSIDEISRILGGLISSISLGEPG